MDSRSGSISSALAGPMAKVEITSGDGDEKEEGEISESEEEVSMEDRGEVEDFQPQVRDMRGSRRLSPRRRSISPVKSILMDRRRPPDGPRRLSGISTNLSGSPSTRVESLETEDQPVSPAGASPGPVSSAPPGERHHNPECTSLTSPRHFP